LRGQWHWDNQGYERDGVKRALEMVWYVLEVQYNLISIRVLMKKDVESKCIKASSQLAKVTG